MTRYIMVITLFFLGFTVFSDIVGQPGGDGNISVKIAESGLYRLELQARAGKDVPRRNIVIRSAFGERLLTAPSGKDWSLVVDYAAIGDFCRQIDLKPFRQGVELGKVTFTRVGDLHLPRQSYVARAEPNADMVPEINPPTFRWPAVGGTSSYTVIYKPVADEWKDAFTNIMKKTGDPLPLFYRPVRALEVGEWEWKLQINGADYAGPFRFTVSPDAEKWDLPPWHDFYRKFKTTRPRLMFLPQDLQRIGENLNGPMKEYGAQLISDLDKGLGKPLTSPEEAKDEHGKGINELMSVLHFARPIYEYLILGNVLKRADFSEEGKRRALLLLQHYRGRKIAVDQDFANGLIVQSLAFTYDYLYHELTPEQRRAIRTEIMARIKSANYRNSLPGYLCDAHAWQISLHQLVCGAMAIWDEEPEARGFLEFSLPLYAALYPWFGGNDGGSAEGPHYGLETNMLNSLVIRQLWLNFCGFDLAGKPWMRNNIWFALYTHPGNIKSSWLNDNGADPSGELGVAAPLFAALHGRTYPNVYAADFASRYLKLEQSDMQRLSRGYMLRLLPLVYGPFPAPGQPVEPLPFARIFRDIGVVIANTDMSGSADNTTLEFRSSPYGAFAHAHADQNSFNIMVRGENLVVDSGYYISWHDNHHYNYTIQTKAHNTILIDGKGQPADCGYGWGRISAFSQGKDYVWMRGDAAKAYLDPVADKFDRGILFLKRKEREIAVIFDDIKVAAAKGEHCYSWLLHLTAKPEINAAKQQLNAVRERSAIQVNWLQPTTLNFSVTDSFDPQPIIWEYRKAHFKNLPPQFHLRAEYLGGAEAKFITVIQTGPQNAAGSFIVPAVSGNVVTIGDLQIVRANGMIEVRSAGFVTAKIKEDELQADKAGISAPKPVSPVSMPAPPVSHLPIFKDGETICFAGDSITQNGTYIEILGDYYRSRYPDRRIKLINCGVGGDTVSDLLPRLDADVLSHKPDWVFVMIGTNDVNRRLYGEGKSGADYERRRAEVKDRYTRKIEELLSRLDKSGVKNIVVMSPTVYDQYAVGDPKQENNIGADPSMAAFGNIAAEAAARHGRPFIDQHAAMLAITRHGQANNPSFTLYNPDRLHPARAGHYVIAERILRAQGETGPMGELSVALNSGNISGPVGGLSKNGDRIAFRIDLPSLPMFIDPIVEQIPELRDYYRALNRTTFRVKELLSGNYQLSINGKKIFSGTEKQFADGIDLAAIGDNPWLLPSRQAAAINKTVTGIVDRKLRRPLGALQSLRRTRPNDSSLPADDVAAVRQLLAAQPPDSRAADSYRSFLEDGLPEVRQRNTEEIDKLRDEADRLSRPLSMRGEISRISP